MSFKDFEKRLYINLEAHKFSICQVLRLPLFAQLEPHTQRAVIMSIHKAHKPTCQCNQCYDSLLRHAIKDRMSPSYLIYITVRQIAMASEATQAAASDAGAVQVAYLKAKVEELKSALAATVSQEEAVKEAVARAVEQCERDAAQRRAMEAKLAEVAKDMAVKEAVDSAVKDTKADLQKEYSSRVIPNADSSGARALIKTLSDAAAEAIEQKEEALKALERATEEADRIKAEASREKEAAVQQATEAASRAAAEAWQAAAAEQERAIREAVEDFEQKSSFCLVCEEKKADQMPFTCQHMVVCEGELTVASGADEDCALRLAGRSQPCPICRCEIRRR